jgi:hypothetical protein
MEFNTFILLIGPRFNCSSCNGVHGILSPLYNVTQIYASWSFQGRGDPRKTFYHIVQ